MNLPRRYTEKRRAEVREREHRRASDPRRCDKPIFRRRDHSEPTIPVRLDEKTVAHVREANMLKYLPYFRDEDHLAAYIDRYKADPRNFLY